MSKKKQSPQAREPDLQQLIHEVLTHAALPGECAGIMGMSVDTVRNYCRRGRFEGAVQFGNEWLIPRCAIEAYMSNSRGRPGNKKATGTETEE